jgi:hypothetical protein
MFFVLLILGAHIAGVCMALALLAMMPLHLRWEFAAAIAADAVVVLGIVVAHWRLASPGLAHSAATPGAPALNMGAEDEQDNSARQEARFLAHAFSLRHLGLQHALMLSLPEGSTPSNSELTRPAVTSSS